MKFLLEFFTCCRPRTPGSSRSAEDRIFLVAQEPRRSMIGEMEGVYDGCRYGNEHCVWKPSLLSISEDEILTEVSGEDIGQPAAEGGRSLKRQVSSSSPQRGSGSCSSSHVRRAPVSTVVRPPLQSSRSFMF